MFSKVPKWRPLRILLSLRKRTICLLLKIKFALIWSSIRSFELSLVKESSHCATPYFASWTQDRIKKSMICHLWLYDQRNLAHWRFCQEDQKTCFFDCKTCNCNWRFPALLPKVGTMSPCVCPRELFQRITLMFEKIKTW